MENINQLMTDSEKDNFSKISLESERKLLEEFTTVANEITPFTSNLIQEIGVTLQRNLSRGLTNIVQFLGYNKSKIRKITLDKEGKITLNIGCANISKDGLINADLFFSGGEVLNIIRGRKRWNIDLFINLGSYDKYLFECADGIVLSHVLEHIYPSLAIKALGNCFNYLKPGGGIRISVPHLEAFNQGNFSSYLGIANRNLAKNYLIYGFHHKFMYDVEILALLMKQAGFSEVQQVFYGKGLLNETDEPSHKIESIYLTAVKI
jgi:predicted SAM-dependent methyltransferase